MKTRQQKQVAVQELTAKMKGAKMVTLTAFAKEGEKGISVGQAQTLKRSLRTLGGEFVVAKKRLINLARQAAGLSDQLDTDRLPGSVGAIIGGAEVDPVKLAKNIYTFAKENPVFQILGAVLDEKYLDQAHFVELAKLPSLEVLLGRLLGMLQYPMTGLVNVLQGNIRELAVVLNQIAIKKN